MTPERMKEIRETMHLPVRSLARWHEMDHGFGFEEEGQLSDRSARMGLDYGEPPSHLHHLPPKLPWKQRITPVLAVCSGLVCNNSWDLSSLPGLWLR